MNRLLAGPIFTLKFLRKAFHYRILPAVMRLIVKLHPGQDSAIDKITALAACNGAQLERVPETDPASETYLTAEVSANYDEAVRVAEVLGRHPGVEAAYVKPPDALPGA